MLKTVEKSGQQTAISKSIIKELRTQFLDDANYTEDQIGELWPKKAKVVSIKLKSNDDRKFEHIIVDKDHHFIHVEKQIIPSLKIVHMYPGLYPKFVVDQGAIKYVIKGMQLSYAGANVMSPGLVNEHSYMDDVQSQRIVSIYVHGHQHAVAIGCTKKSTAEIKADKQGLAVETIHFIGDGFWNLLYKEN